MKGEVVGIVYQLIVVTRAHTLRDGRLGKYAIYDYCFFDQQHISASSCVMWIIMIYLTL